jgi:ketosteroid isomerase-like protein
MSDEQDVIAAAMRFYDAIEDLVDGRGAARMVEAWHHAPRVTCAHPFDEWSVGWDAIFPTWQELVAVGKPGLGGSHIRDLNAFVCGDAAYTIGIFHVSPGLGGGKLKVTNVLHRVNGIWKVVHHHADKASSMATEYERLASET